jgi:hypothetical protein
MNEFFMGVLYNCLAGDIIYACTFNLYFNDLFGGSFDFISDLFVSDIFIDYYSDQMPNIVISLFLRSKGYSLLFMTSISMLSSGFIITFMPYVHKESFLQSTAYFLSKISQLNNSLP